MNLTNEEKFSYLFTALIIFPLVLILAFIIIVLNKFKFLNFLNSIIIASIIFTILLIIWFYTSKIIKKIIFKKNIKKKEVKN